jgi:ADP-ribose pyrophosphatase YjhB (NUDIX family)
MTEKVLLKAVLVYVVTKTEVLLAVKQDKIGAGCLNGYGGGIEKEDVSHIQAAIRETGEESGGLIVKPEALHLVAVVDFHNRTHEGKKFTCRVYVYLLNQWEGTARTTKEMANPTWFPKDDLPFNMLMPADPFWLPRVLAGETMYVEAWYGPEQKVLEREVKVTLISQEELNRL